MIRQQLQEEIVRIIEGDERFNGIIPPHLQPEIDQIMQKIEDYVQEIIGEDLTVMITTEMNSSGAEYEYNWASPINEEKAKQRKRAGL